MSIETIHIGVTLSAEIEKAWKYYTQPEHITQWNFATEDWQCPSAENDLRPGGKYKARMEAKDGSFGFDFEAVYDEVVPGERLSYTMTDGRTASVRFIENENITEVHISFEAETENDLELQRQGWQAILDNFKKYAEKQA